MESFISFVTALFALFFFSAWLYSIINDLSSGKYGWAFISLLIFPIGIYRGLYYDWRV